MWNKVNTVYTVLNLLSLVEESMGSIIKTISFQVVFLVDQGVIFSNGNISNTRRV